MKQKAEELEKVKKWKNEAEEVLLEDGERG